MNFKAKEWELEHEKREAGSLKMSGYSGFLKGELHGQRQPGSLVALLGAMSYSW